VNFSNCYDNPVRADSYASLEFANTYYLAFRDLPALVCDHVKGTKALDFGCGTGRSTRFIRQLGFDTIGIDIAADMIARAKELDPGGDYSLTAPGDFGGLPAGTFDLVLCMFPFDNIAGFDVKLGLIRGLTKLLNESGALINVVSSPEIYLHEWASFTTKEFPQNAEAKSGDVVRIITTDFADRTPAVDILCTDESYRELYLAAGLEVIAMHNPLATGDEPYTWVSEATIAPWTLYVLRRSRG
jgi:SAM-dependent methyltransferase